MSKTVKEMISRDYAERFGGETELAVISIRGVNANDNNEFRSKLREKQIRVSIVRNTLAKRQFEGTALEALAPVLTGPSALAYGGQSVVEVARELVELIKTFPEVELKGAVLDGELFEGAEGVERLSKFPTREEAIAKTVQLILSPAQKLVASTLGPGRKLASLVKAIEEKLEKGEEIAKVG
jgi:large subunit ribosomal protein L10